MDFKKLDVCFLEQYFEGPAFHALDQRRQCFYNLKTIDIYLYFPRY